MRTSTVATLGLVLLTAGAALLTLQNFHKAGTRSAAASTQELPRYTLKNAQWTRLDGNGQPEYVAQAQALEYFDDESSRMVQPRISAFGGRTSPWRLTAPEGSTQAGSRDVLLKGEVKVHGRWQDGRELTVTTPHLWLDTTRQVLRTDARVILDSAGRKMRAKGLIADSAGQEVKLLGEVQGIYEGS